MSDLIAAANALEVNVRIDCDQWARVLADAAQICERTSQQAFAMTVGPQRSAEVSILLADDELIRDLNRRYRGCDAPTNVLSFPAFDVAPTDRISLNTPEWVLGDIVVAYETAAAEAAAAKTSLANHLSHLLVHGMLHLLGYDHQTDDAAEAMERREREILGVLGVADPYASDTTFPR